MRFRLDLAYDGTGFHGWARQPGLRTVQGELERALGIALRTDPPATTCAGRTDTGVHARGQVAHVDLDPAVVADSAGPPDRRHGSPVEVLRRRLDGILDPDVRVRRLAEAAEGFDARFSALWRRYAYRVADRPDTLDPLTRGQVLWWSRPLDADRMDRGAAALLGEHDFASFCKRREGATTVRTLLDVGWRRGPDGVLLATVRADAFCHHMVRSLVGCLLAVGEGRRDLSWPGEVLASGQRDPAVTVVPAHGLTLEEVAYPDVDLAAQADRARRRRDVPVTAGQEPRGVTAPDS